MHQSHPPLPSNSRGGSSSVLVCIWQTEPIFKISLLKDVFNVPFVDTHPHTVQTRDAPMFLLGNNSIQKKQVFDEKLYSPRKQHAWLKHCQVCGLSEVFRVKNIHQICNRHELKFTLSIRLDILMGTG